MSYWRTAGVIACAVLLTSCQTLSPDGGMGVVAAIAGILALATLPLRTEIAADRFWQAQLRAALETVRVAGETRRAYYRAVAASKFRTLRQHRPCRFSLPTPRGNGFLAARDKRPRIASEAALLRCRDCKPALRPRKTGSIRQATGNLG
jgi:hypothetical protein